MLTVKNSANLAPDVLRHDLGKGVTSIMKAKLTTIAVLFALTTLPTAANAGTILAPASGGWEYTFSDPTADPTWNTTTGGWAVGGAPFGNVFAGDFGYGSGGTLWEEHDELWVRRTVDFTGFDLSSIRWNLGVDNGFALYLNGVLISSANAEGYTFRWEYPNGTFAGALPGTNILAVALEDHGGLTAFDMEITGTALPVPDLGGTLPLLLTALGALGIGYNRSRLG